MSLAVWEWKRNALAWQWWRVKWRAPAAGWIGLDTGMHCMLCMHPVQPMTKDKNSRTKVKGYKSASSPVNRVCGRIPRIPPESATVSVTVDVMLVTDGVYCSYRSGCWYFRWVTRWKCANTSGVRTFVKCLIIARLASVSRNPQNSSSPSTADWYDVLRVTTALDKSCVIDCAGRLLNT